MLDKRKTYKYTGKDVSLVEVMRNYTDDYHITHYRLATAIEKEFLKRKKLLLII